MPRSRKCGGGRPIRRLRRLASEWHRGRSSKQRGRSCITMSTRRGGWHEGCSRLARKTIAGPVLRNEARVIALSAREGGAPSRPYKAFPCRRMARIPRSAKRKATRHPSVATPPMAYELVGLAEKSLAIGNEARYMPTADWTPSLVSRDVRMHGGLAPKTKGCDVPHMKLGGGNGSGWFITSAARSRAGTKDAGHAGDRGCPQRSSSTLRMFEVTFILDRTTADPCEKRGNSIKK